MVMMNKHICSFNIAKCQIIQTSSNSIGWNPLGLIGSESSSLVWIGSLVTMSLGLTNTNYKVLSSMNMYGFNLLTLTSIGLGSNLSMVTNKTLLLGKQYYIL